VGTSGALAIYRVQGGSVLPECEGKFYLLTSTAQNYESAQVTTEFAITAIASWNRFDMGFARCVALLPSLRLVKG